MKKALSITLLLAFLIFGGCHSKPTTSISEQFLLKFYTANDISSMQTSYNKLTNSNIDEQDTIEFHKPLAKFMTDTGLQRIIANRNYLSIYEMVLDGNVTLSPSNIKLTQMEGSIDFSLTVKVVNLSSEIEKEVNQTGQIIISDTGKIDGAYFYNIVELQQQQ